MLYKIIRKLYLVSIKPLEKLSTWVLLKGNQVKYMSFRTMVFLI